MTEVPRRRFLTASAAIAAGAALGGNPPAAHAAAALPSAARLPGPVHPPGPVMLVRVSASRSDGTAPAGLPGRWSVVLDDGFSGHSIDRTVWTIGDGDRRNGTTTSPANVSIVDSCAVLRLASRTSGAEIHTRHALFQVGDYVEFRARFPGDGKTLVNWPAVWTSGPGWPAAGEIDIAEVGRGRLTSNYHGLRGAQNHDATPGYWGDRFHTFGALRGGRAVEIYWDGVKRYTIRTADNGAGQNVLASMGCSGHRYRPDAALQVDHVRVFRPRR